MKYTFFDILQQQSLRLSLCCLAVGFCTSAMAQDVTEDDGSAGFNAPKRAAVKDKNHLISVSGVVFDNATKTPLAGARIQVLGNEKYTAMSNAEGKFTIKLPDFASALYVSAPRHMSQQVGINANDTKQTVRISMLSDKFRTMYGNYTDYTAKASTSVRGGNAVIDEDIERVLGADVRSIQRSGSIDGGASMFIRGLNSLNANAQPLIIIDGVEMDMQQERTVLHIGRAMNMLSTLSPEDIENVTVLKNATALYGSRGANGVIIIETKRGHSMATRIDANISAGITLKPRQFSMMNGDQWRTYATEMLGTISALRKPENRDITFNFLDDNPDRYYYPIYHNNTDWQDEVYRTAITQNYSINVQGGDDIGMYNLSVGYLDSKSPIKESNFDRLNVRFNTDIKILWNLETKFDMSFSRTNNTLFDNGFASDLGASTITSPTALSLIKSPLCTPYQYNKHVGGFTSLLSSYDDLFAPLSQAVYGNSYGYSLANPVAILQVANGDNKNKVENTFFNVHIAPKYIFSDRLSVTTAFSYYLNRNSQRYYRPTEGVPPFEVAGLGTVFNKTQSLFAKETNILSDTHADWNNKYGAHSINATLGFRYTYFSYDGSDASTDYKSAQNDKNPFVSADTNSGYPGIGGANDVWKNMQWYASADYDYQNRYFATVSLLAEANSRFGENASGALKAFGTQWAIFPSVQLGWVMSNENWFPKNNIVNYLRVNAGFDISGNDGIDNYAALTSFNAIRFNGDAIGVQLTNIGNDKIKWETTNKFNFGFQANMLNNRVGVNFNYFIHKTNDLLTLVNFSTPISGINNYWTNGGKLENKGFEATVTGKPIVAKNLSLEIGASVGHYKNEVTALPERSFTDGAKHFSDGTYVKSVYGDNNIIVAKGNPAGLFYGYQTHEYVFATDAEAAKAGKDGYLYMLDESGNKEYFKAGDVHFVDQNNDGVIDENDKVVIGDPNPDIYGNIFATLNYKNFTLDLGFNYSLGNDVYNYQRSILNSGSTFYNQQVKELSHWRYEGQVTALPRLAYGDPKGNNRFSDRWIEDGSYLRLKNVRLTYKINIPEAWQSWLQGLSVWGEAQNVFTLTKYTGIDPEFSAGNSVFYQGIDCGTIAQSRAFVLGVKINL